MTAQMDARMQTCKVVASESTVWSTNMLELPWLELKAGLEIDADHKHVSMR